MSGQTLERAMSVSSVALVRLLLFRYFIEALPNRKIDDSSEQLR